MKTPGTLAGLLLVSCVLLLAVSMGFAQERGTFLSVPPWGLQPDTARYGPGNLYDIIDGAADGYLGFGFVELLNASYRNGSGLEFRLELYRHDTALDAFGVYAQERKPGYHFTSGLGVEGYVDQGIVNFLHGQYYVKLSSHDTGAAASAALLDAARLVSGKLGSPKPIPAEFSLFPSKDRIVRGEYYIARDFLGLSILGGAFVAPYTGASRYELFIIEHANVDAATARLSAYLKTIGSPPLGAGFSYLDPHIGRLGIAAKGRYVVGVTGIENAEACTAKVKELLLRLP